MIEEFKELRVGTDTSMSLKNCHQNLDILIRGESNTVKVPSFLKFHCILRLIS